MGEGSEFTLWLNSVCSATDGFSASSARSCSRHSVSRNRAGARRASPASPFLLSAPTWSGSTLRSDFQLSTFHFQLFGPPPPLHPSGLRPPGLPISAFGFQLSAFPPRPPPVSFRLSAPTRSGSALRSDFPLFPAPRSDLPPSPQPNGPTMLFGSIRSSCS
jgi:hypothetical protein